jgi:hypothetical protein
MANTFNMKNPDPGEVQGMYAEAKARRARIVKHKMLK